MSCSRRRTLTHWLPLLAGTPWSAGAAPKRPATLRLVATEFPPYTSAGLPDGGIAVAMTQAAFKRAGLDSEVHYRPWARVMVEAERGEWDAVIGVWHSAERERFLAFPKPLGITNRIGFMARAGTAIKVDKLNELSGVTVGVVRGYANPPAFDQTRLRREEAVDDLTNLRKLKAGHIDLALVDKGVAFHLLQTELREVARAFTWLEPAVADLPLYTALARRNPKAPALLDAFNKGLAELQSSGELARLLARSARWL
jgi:polar amino acid transport system substrate-binding protein